jgi:uncharacterized coiled-coil DUF342 family protein
LEGNSKRHLLSLQNQKEVDEWAAKTKGQIEQVRDMRQNNEHISKMKEVINRAMTDKEI